MMMQRSRGGRRKTTGNWRTRDKLVEEVLWYHRNTSMSLAALARQSGISAATAKSIIAENVAA